MGNQEELYWQAIEVITERGVPTSLKNVFFYGFQDATAIMASFLETIHKKMGENSCQLFLHKTLDPLAVAEKNSIPRIRLLMISSKHVF